MNHLCVDLKWSSAIYNYEQYFSFKELHSRSCPLLLINDYRSRRCKFRITEIVFVSFYSNWLGYCFASLWFDMNEKFGKLYLVRSSISLLIRQNQAKRTLFRPLDRSYTCGKQWNLKFALPVFVVCWWTTIERQYFTIST